MKYTTALLPPPEGRSHVIAILALPVHMSVKDFCNIVASFEENVKYIRFLREMEKRRTMVLMEMISSEAAADFYTEFNGKRFNSLERKTCRVIFVANVILETKMSIPECRGCEAASVRVECDPGDHHHDHEGPPDVAKGRINTR